MAERHILPLEKPIEGTRETGKSVYLPPPNKPTFARQVQRVGPKFDRIEKLLSKDSPELELQRDPTSIAPGRALVFEVAGSLGDFKSQAEKLGFGFIGEMVEEIDPTDDFYFKDEKKKLSETLYLLMPDIRAMQQLLAFWGKFKRTKTLPYGYGLWKQLFASLIDIRPWGPSDRLTEGFLHTLSNWLQQKGTNEPFRFEVDLWHSESTGIRNNYRQEVVNELSGIGGEILDESIIEPIRYHGLLCQVPRSASNYLENPEISFLARMDSIMFLNPQAMTAFAPAEALEGTDISPPDTPNEPVAALLDGFPMANHDALSDSLDIDDFLSLEQSCPAAYRNHGTSMSSLILHGDMHNESTNAIRSRLLVLPILRPDTADGNVEKVPDERLAIDVVYRAVRRIKSGDGSMSLNLCKRPFVNPLGTCPET